MKEGWPARAGVGDRRLLQASAGATPDAGIVFLHYLHERQVADPHRKRCSPAARGSSRGSRSSSTGVPSSSGVRGVEAPRADSSSGRVRGDRGSDQLARARPRGLRAQLMRERADILRLNAAVSSRSVTEPARRGGVVQSVARRSLDLLEALALPGELGLVELAQRTGLHQAAPPRSRAPGA